MSDWLSISQQDFIAAVKSSEPAKLKLAAGKLIIDRLPATFESKDQYFEWRAKLAEGLEVDDRDIVLVGSAQTGRSLNAKKQFKVFTTTSDLDIAVVSRRHFDIAWHWFRHADPLLIPFDDEGKRLFVRHREQYIFDGMIAANYFLQYLPFGNAWMRELQRSTPHLPLSLQGRKMNVRIYMDNEALRHAQANSLQTYRNYLNNKGQSNEGSASNAQ
jgi:hypothetical protein